MQLPLSEKIPVRLLAACFNSTSATYKFYWLLSILQEIEEGKQKISKQHLFARMIANAWYTVNYFHVSFGKQDLIQDAIDFVNKQETIAIDQNRQAVFQRLISSGNPEVIQKLKHFDKNVPHWFLSPWFPAQGKSAIYLQSKLFSNDCLYGLYSDWIEINPRWEDYLRSNLGILKDFCYWNLTLFLQARNPNVPDIANKLIKPAGRNSLTAQRTKFWNIVFQERNTIPCIYTAKELVVADYALDHFVPYNFVSHDLIWNLIPAHQSFNSTKSDKLPSLEKHFSSFFELHHSAIQIIKEKTPGNKFLEDYLTIFPDLSSITEEKFRERIQPLITIAANNGFQFMADY